MTWLSTVIHKQGKLLLENSQQALLQAIAFALLPYTAWLSVAIIALVTLRKGWRNGALLLIPVIGANFALSLLYVNATIASINALLTFIPCYLAACTLRLTVNWRAVALVFFLQVMLVLLLVQIIMPDVIMAQYLYFQAMIRDMQAESAFLTLLTEQTNLNQQALAYYLLGLQAIGIVFSASLSLMFARSLQSQLFYPGGFKREMLAFRGDKLGLLILVGVLVAANQHNLLAMSLLPVVMFYFLLAGLSLSFNVLAKQKPWRTLILLGASLFLLPFIMLPVYVIFGSLDSLFNFRLYLPSEAGKTV
jgi:hypothetical protein